MTSQAIDTGARKDEKLPLRLHHHAFLVQSQERTRHFYEDVIGLPLKAAWIENIENNGKLFEYSHAFYGIGDGGALAFFAIADPEIYEEMSAGPQKSLCYHVALKTDEETQARIRDRCVKGGYKIAEFDHGYCKSLYVTDPDGLQVEFTVDPENVGAINAMQERTAHDTLRRWEAGDRTPNNDIRLSDDIEYVP